MNDTYTQNVRTMADNIGRLSDDQLHKELTFAILMEGPSREERTWLRLLKQEAEGRGWMQDKNLWLREEKS